MKTESEKATRCFFWGGDCGFRAVAEILSHGKWKPICGQHLHGLRRRKTGLKPQERALPGNELPPFNDPKGVLRSIKTQNPRQYLRKTLH
jgi:hypothetical protein